MAKFLPAIVLLFTLKTASAQVSANAIATATIVNPVGTEEISNEDLQYVTLPSIQNEKVFPSFLTNHLTKQLDVAKFRVVNSALLYSLTINDNTAFHSSYTLEAKPLNTATKSESFYLDATVYTGVLQKNQRFHALLEVTIHFN